MSDWLERSRTHLRRTDLTPGWLEVIDVANFESVVREPSFALDESYYATLDILFYRVPRLRSRAAANLWRGRSRYAHDRPRCCEARPSSPKPARHPPQSSPGTNCNLL